MEIFREWIQNIVVFLLVTTMASQLIPDEKYRKYIRLTIGLLLILVILLPLTRLTGLDETFYRNFIQESLQTSTKNIRLEKQIFEEDELLRAGYGETLQKEIQAYFEVESMGVNYCEIEMNEDTADKNFGEIYRLRIGLRTRDGLDQKADTAGGVHISEIRIGEGEKPAAGKGTGAVPEAKQKQWRRDLSLQFGVAEAVIELEIVS